MNSMLRSWSNLLIAHLRDSCSDLKMSSWVCGVVTPICSRGCLRADRRLPAYTQLDLPSSKISLDFLAEHSRNNLVIEFGTELFSWLLAFIIVQFVLLFVDKIAGHWGCLIDIIAFVIILATSVIMTTINDSKLIASLRSQYNQSELHYNSEEIVKSLNENRELFYESL